MEAIIIKSINTTIWTQTDDRNIEKKIFFNHKFHCKLGKMS